VRTPAAPLGDIYTERPVQAPSNAGVGIVIPPRRDPCCVQWYAVQHDACDIDDPDPPPMTRRQMTTDRQE
jgi:hypothetical protein